MVDDLNPVLAFTKREVESLLHFVDEEPEPSQVELQPQSCMEGVLRKALHLFPDLVTKVGHSGPQNGVLALPLMAHTCITLKVYFFPYFSRRRYRFRKVMILLKQAALVDLEGF